MGHQRRKVKSKTTQKQHLKVTYDRRRQAASVECPAACDTHAPPSPPPPCPSPLEYVDDYFST